MAKRVLYNVGVVDIGGTQKNIYRCSADGVEFLMMVSGTGTEKYKYLPWDYVRAEVGLNKAVLDGRLDTTILDNAAAPTYTTASTSGGFRYVALDNAVDTVVENYTGQPFYSIKGDGVAEFTASATATVIPSTSSVASTAALTTGVDFIDQIIKFITDNLAIVLIGVAVLLYFDPFGWMGKKKKRRFGRA